MALTLDSKHTKDSLQSLHENIIGKKRKTPKYMHRLRYFLIVLRHPDHHVGGTFFWSHHEKFVIVDNKIAFLGGIDLCFG